MCGEKELAVYLTIADKLFPEHLNGMTVLV